MLKSPLIFWLISATLIFSGLMNIVHVYEHDEDEHHSVECEICIHLSQLTDAIPVGSVMPTYSFSEVENYLFVVKNNFTPAIPSTHPRAPPLAHTLT